MRNFLKFLTIFALITVGYTSIGSANEVSESQQFIEAIGKTVIGSLTNEKLSQKDRDDILKNVLSRNFDIPKIGHFVLGRYALGATGEQFGGFLNAFEGYILALYSKQFDHYSGEQFKVTKVYEPHSRRNRVVVFAEILSNNKEPIRLSFLVDSTVKNNFKILDVKIQGISMISTLRADYTSFLGQNNGNVDKLTEALKLKVAQLTSN